MNFVDNWLFGRILNRLENAMGSGWKGKTGGIGLMLSGLAGLITGFSNGTLTAETAISYFGMLTAGLGVFGIRQAIDHPPGD